MSDSPLPLFVLRRGLPNTASRLACGQAVNVAYFGGSITQAGAERDGYRGLTTGWLRQQFPAVKITEINAAIGGTGSDLGAFRLRQDVLRFKPDLLLIEFAVNDSDENHDVPAAMEGIVRHTRRECPACDLAFIYTLEQGMLGELRANRLPPASRRHEPVAEHYGLPSINVAVDVARRLDRKELTWEEFSGDSCHPTTRGHELYARTIAEALGALLAAKRQSPAHSSNTPHDRNGSLPAPLSRDPWEAGDLLTIDPERHQFPGWSYRPLVNRGGWECFDGVLESEIPGSEAILDFHGSVVGLYHMLGPQTGDLLWSVDDDPLRPARLFDNFAPQFWRPHYAILARDLKPGPHRLRIRVSDQRDPRATGNWIKIAHLLHR